MTGWPEPGGEPDRTGSLTAVRSGRRTQWAQDCAVSRMWAGVHFRDARTRGAALGTQIGDSVYVFVDRHIRGAVGALR